MPAAWVAGDEVYGADPMLRRHGARASGSGYVLQVAANRRVPTHAGPIRVDELARHRARLGVADATPPGRAAKGRATTPGPGSPCCPKATTPTHAGQHHLLIRRNPGTGELAYLRCYSPHPVPLSTLVRVAGQRWRIEESFQAAKGLIGLDQHQVRRWTSWHRWTTLAMLAHAFLAVATATERDHTPTPAGMIELTVNEFRRLFDALLLGHQTHHRHPARLVTMAPTTSSPRPRMPLPSMAATTPMITN